MLEVSVVIPTLGRGRILRRVLDHLDRQDLDPSRFEVLVVTDPGEPDPHAVADALSRRSYPTRQLTRHAPGVSAARNRGWRAATAGIVLFLGDDILPARALLTEHLAGHRREPDEHVGVLGHVSWSRELKVTPFMRWLEHGIQFDYPNIRGTEAGWGRFYTSNASVKRDLLERVGGFDDQRFPFGYEDLDIAYRMSAFGFRLLYNRDAVAEHLHPVDLDSWRRRVAQVAEAEHRFVEAHPEVEPYFYGLFSSAAAQAPARGRGRWLIGVVPRRLPWLGGRAWESADLYFRQALAPRFLDAWQHAGASRRRCG